MAPAIVDDTQFCEVSPFEHVRPRRSIKGRSARWQTHVAARRSASSRPTRGFNGRHRRRNRHYGI